MSQPALSPYSTKGLNPQIAPAAIGGLQGLDQPAVRGAHPQVRSLPLQSEIEGVEIGADQMLLAHGALSGGHRA